MNAKSQDKQELNVLERSTVLNVKPDSLSRKCSGNLTVLVTLDQGRDHKKGWTFFMTFAMGH